MKILAYVHYYLPHNRGGAEVMLHNMLRSLVYAGHDVTVVATQGPEGAGTVDDVMVLGGRKAAAAALKRKWDRIITHFDETPNAYAWAKKKGVHFTQIVHNQMQLTKDYIPRDADLTVYNTQWVRKEVELPGDGPSIVVHPPVNPADHATEPGECITLINLIPEKGSATFYRSALVLKRYQFLGVEGGYYHSRQIFRQMPNVTHQTHTQDMREDVWARTRLLIMPSSYESFGQVALEAAASGIPTIATSTPGLHECLGDAGTYMPSSQSPGWSQMIRRMMEDTELYETASKLSLDRSQYMEDQTRKELKAWVDTLESA